MIAPVDGSGLTPACITIVSRFIVKNKLKVFVVEATQTNMQCNKILLKHTDMAGIALT